MSIRLLVAILCLSWPAAPVHGVTPAPDILRPAHEALAAGDTASAVAWLERSHRRTGDSSAYVLLGRLLRERGTIAGRLRSQRVLENARSRFPKDMDVRMELGRTYFAQRFFPDAVSSFNAVLAREPRRCDARYLVGMYHYQNWKRMNEYGDDLVAARRELRAAVACDTTNADAALRYLVACYALGDTSTADCSRMIRRFPDRAEFRLQRGVLAYDAGRIRACEQDFTAGIALLDDATREVYGRVGRVLPVTERDRVDAFPADERDAVTRAYWIGSDPDPTTAINERELEHVYRMYLADVLYSHGPLRKRGWDTDRGQAFVKFGRPMSIEYTLGDDNSSGKVETWSYVLGGVFHQYLFVDEFLNGNPRIPYSADVLLHYMMHAPRQTAYQAPVIPVPGELDIVTFRDDGMAASVYLAMRIDADSLRAATDLSRVDRFVVRTAWFDPAWRRSGASLDSVWTSDVPARRAGGGARYDVVRRARVAHDRFHFACVFEDQRGAARVLLRGDADAARFVGDRLAVSDILLTAENGDPRVAIERGAERLWPRIDRRYERGEMLRAYFEIYNLTRVARATEYSVRYAIYPALAEDAPVWLDWGRRVGDLLGIAEGDPAISQTFRRAGGTHEDHESIGIDLGRLAPGRYELVVEVTDARSGQRAVAHTRFQREGERVAEER
ncbi:MAG TPA: GWxTD domain-containing protein [Candidatus Krumholzibacteria bacterium]|nr:GWxTD domain-containing protein [Candidatus Krumholzibacteria bacterium]